MGITWQEYMTANYTMLRATCKRMTRDDDRADIVMSDVVVEVLPRILENYDADRDGACPLDQWVKRNVRWYVYKWLLKEDKRKGVLTSLVAAEVREDMRLSYRDEENARAEDVEFGRALYAAMPQGERDLCVMRHIMGLTIREIAERCSWSVGYAQLRTVNATETMRETALKLLER